MLSHQKASENGPSTSRQSTSTTNLGALDRMMGDHRITPRGAAGGSRGSRGSTPPTPADGDGADEGQETARSGGLSSHRLGAPGSSQITTPPVQKEKKKLIFKKVAIDVKDP